MQYFSFGIISPAISLFTFIGSFFRLLNPKLLDSKGVSETFPESEDYELGFSQHYERYLKDKVVRFETERILALKKSRRNLFISLPIILLIPVCVVNIDWYAIFGENTLEFLFFIIVLVYCAIGWFVTKSMTLYQNSIKEEIFPNILNFFGSFNYSREANKNANDYNYSGLLPSFHRQTNEDHINGNYKDVEIDLYETELEQRRRRKNSTYYVTVFKGILITLSMNKNFMGKTIVRKDSGAIGNWFRKTFTSLKNVKLEDPKFEKIFEVFSDDQVEARYLLTVSFMERLKQLAEVFGGKTIQCCFYEKKLLIVIPLKKDMFEPGSIFEPEDFIDDSKSLLAELNLIFGIVDTLKLNMKVNL